MADLNKFEEMLEKLVNEDRAGAEELFHDIVVEKSREIYENLLETDLEDEEVDEATDEEVDEATDEEVDEATDEEVDESDEEVEEGFDLDEFEVEPVEADAGDDFIDDVMDGGDDDEEGDDEDDEDMDDEDMEDRLVDLEQELDKLRAEFEAEMGDEGDDMDADDEDEEEAEEGFDLGMEEATDEEVDEATDEEVEEATDEEVEEGEKSEAEQMREYVEKVTASMGDNGANTKSPVASANDMGGDAGNIAQGGDESGMTPAKPKEDDMGNVNVPGGKASKSMKNMPKGHGAEKKGAGETADNKKSAIGS